mgnify:CR=1 FL=1
MELQESDYEDQPVRQIKRAFEPRTRYDFVKVMAHIVKRPIPQMLALTKHFPDKWFIDIASEAKQLKTEEAKAKFIWWFLKESRTKETNLTQI